MRFPPLRVRVRHIHVNGAIERSEPRLVRFCVEPNPRRKIIGPWQSRRIYGEMSEAALFVNEIQVRMIVRDNPSDVRHDGRKERPDITLSDDRLGHLQQCSPVIALGLQLALMRHRLLLLA